jgi:hypothetical protein
MYRPHVSGRGRSSESRLPRFTATEHEISFAADRKKAEELLAGAEEVVLLLVHRARERQPGQKQQAGQAV